VEYDDAVTQAAQVTGMNEGDMRDFLSPQLTNQDRIDILQRYRDAQIEPSRFPWDEALKILSTVASIAGMILPIIGAVDAVYGLVK
jgi:hypothetical protein